MSAQKDNKKLEALLEAGSVLGFIAANYTGREALEIAQQDDWMEFGDITECQKISRRHNHEISDYCSFGDATGFHAPDDNDPVNDNDILICQVNKAMQLIIKDVYEKHEDVLDAHPEKTISTVVNMSYREALWMMPPGEIANYRGIDDYIKSRYRGKDLLGVRTDKSFHSIISDEDALRLYSSDNVYFKHDIEEFGDYDVAKRYHKTPAKVIAEMTNTAIKARQQVLYEQYKEQIIKAPELVINEALSAQKEAAGRGRGD